MTETQVTLAVVAIAVTAAGVLVAFLHWLVPTPIKWFKDLPYKARYEELLAERAGWRVQAKAARKDCAQWRNKYLSLKNAVKL